MYKDDINYHLVFVTKYRKKVLNEQLLSSIKEILYDTAESHHFKIIDFGSENQDHIHLVLKIKPTQCISKLVQLLQQYSRFYCWQLYPTYLRQFYWYKNYLWNSEYFCSNLGNVSKDIVLKYVEKQN